MHGEERFCLGGDDVSALDDLGEALKSVAENRVMAKRSKGLLDVAADAFFELNPICGLVRDAIQSDDDDVSVHLSKDGLDFGKSGWSVKWCMVCECSWEEEDEEGDSYDSFTFTSGLKVRCPSDRVQYDDPDEADAVMAACQKNRAQPIETLLEKKLTPTKLVEALDDYLRAVTSSCQMCGDLLTDDSLIVDCRDCARVIYAFETLMANGLCGSAKCRQAVANWCQDHAESCMKLAGYISGVIGEDECYDDEDRRLAAARLADFELFLRVLIKDDSEPSFDKYDYALYHTSVAVDKAEKDNWAYDSAVEWLAEEFSKDAFAKERKVIICTDEPRKIMAMGEDIPRVAVLRAETLEAAIDRNASYRFDLGHPQNGVTYVQHPLDKNRYIDINTFNTSLLERKYDELVCLLESLGASSIVCSVSNDVSSQVKTSRKQRVDAEAHGNMVGSVSGSYDGSSFKDRLSNLNKRLSCRIERKPLKKPSVPDGLLFYQMEDRWQRMASDVLSGQRKYEEVDLSYREEYSISGSEARTIGGKVESMIPGYQFGGSANYATEYESELKELKAITWHYEVSFDAPAVSEADEVPVAREANPRAKRKLPNRVPVESDVPDDARAKVVKTARRYAKTPDAQQSGMITDLQRSDLERLLTKYGLDDDVDDIIEEAFEA